MNNNATAFLDRLLQFSFTNPPIQILVIGRKNSAEFQPVVRFLDSLDSRSANSLFVEKLADDIQSTTRQLFHPDIVVVLQTHPDEFGEQDIIAIIGRNPLTCPVCCYGSWCESFQRTRNAWPVACCVPVKDAVKRIQQDLIAITGANPPLPLTATRAESFDYNSA